MIGSTEENGLCLFELLNVEKENPVFSIFKLSFDLLFLLLQGVILRFTLPFILYALRFGFTKIRDFIRDTVIGYRIPKAPVDIVHSDSFVNEIEEKEKKE